MRRLLIFLLAALLLLSGCRYQVVENPSRAQVNAPEVNRD